MSKHVRHIWAKANQHIKVHRRRPHASNGNEHDNTLYVIIAIVVFIWIIM